MTVTPDHAKMLTALALAIRPHGAPRWDGPGVMAAIRKVAHLQLADVTRAVTRAAEDHTLETPGPIGIPTSPCWRDKTTLDERPTRNVVPRWMRCTTCDQDEERCRRLWGPTGDPKRDEHEGRHEFERRSPRDVDITPVVAEVKGHVEPTKPAPATHTPAGDPARAALGGKGEA